MTTCRVIRKDGFLYRLAYRHLKEEDRPTANVNLCDTVWLAMISMLGLITLGLLLITLAFIAFAFIAVIGFGIWLVSASFIAWLTDPHLPPIGQGRLNMLVMVGISIAVFLGFWTTAYGVRAFVKGEPGQLLVAYLRAKKEKFCPIYEVV
jgi:hypothetical protein